MFNFMQFLLPSQNMLTEQSPREISEYPGDNVLRQTKSFETMQKGMIVFQTI